MILFQILRYKNFLSTGQAFIEIPLNSSDNTLIVGKNGSGKSTMLDALCFVLFGKPFRKITKSLISNSINKSQTLVEVEFSTNGTQYKIVRGAKPNVFEIYQNGTLVNQDANSRDYQEYLDKYILRCNYKSFTQIVILGSASHIPFMQLSAAERRAVIEDILDIQVFSTMNVIAKQMLQSLTSNITMNKMNLEAQEESKKILDRQVDSLQNTNEQEIIRLTDNLTSYNDKILKLQSEFRKHEEDIAAFDTQSQPLEPLRKFYQQQRNCHSKLQLNTKLTQEDIQFFSTHDSCPKCLQAISHEHKQDMVYDHTKNLTDFTQGLNELQEQIAKTEAEIEELEFARKKLWDAQGKKNTTQNLLVLAKNERKTVREKLEHLQTSESLLTQNIKELEDVRLNIVSLSAEREKMLIDREYLEMAIALLKDGGIKAKIIYQYLPVINAQVNRYLAALDFFVNFELNENFEETIKSRYRDEFSYNSFSEGEKLRIDLALLLTWRIVAKKKNSIATNLLILDEIFDSSLDGDGVDEFLKLMATFESENIFVISHKGQALYDKFSKVLEFNKVKNFSVMKEIK
jgi:DNA repair exonuclease SbcCD ATPase subunit